MAVMTNVWMAAVLTATATLAACESKSTTTPAATPAATVEPAATTVAMAATTGDAVAMAATTGDAAAVATGAATPAAAEGEKNVLGLKLPKIDKTRVRWQHDLKPPDPLAGKFDAKKDYFATIHTTKGDITVKFFPEVAPRHVTNFIYLSEVGYYDNAPFHRVCKDFMIQGGDPSGQGTGGPGYNVKQEFNPRKHVKGVLSMARTGDPNGAGSQFFLMFDPAPFLDNQYTVFGQTVEGMNVIDDFEKTVAVPQSVPGCKPQSLEKIKTVTVFTKDKK
jgi:peptidyl-prolyl cis-trans isomerase B (cyclophilin B)